MKGLIFRFGFIFVLLATACSSKISPQKMGITEESQLFLPVINEFDGEITAAAVSTQMPPKTATMESRQTSDQDFTNTPVSTIFPPIQNTEEKSNIVLFEPPLQIPIPAGYTQEIDKTYRYGTTQAGTRIPHDGVEFYNASGTPVIATGDGKVYFAGSDAKISYGQFKDFYGNLVIIEHKITGIEFPIYSLYAHLSSIDVSTGDLIKLGEKIGEVGASGSAIGSHLHFEVRINLPNLENRVNPELYLKLINNAQETLTGILVGSILDNQGNHVPQSDFVIQLIENGQISPNKVYYLETYASDVPSDPRWDENFVISNLPVGHYRISAFIDNQFEEKYIDIAYNSLTEITLSENN